MLSPLIQKFVLHWGEMASRWGVNRTVAQTHALLFASPVPLSAADIAQDLSVARSNVSVTLRELQGWGVIRVVHKVGDRRDFFEAVSEPWQMILAILKTRRERELDPAVRILRECIAAVPPSSEADQQAVERMRGLVQSLEKFQAMFERISEPLLDAVPGDRR